MKTLLPSGCYDVLPPLARLESRLSSTLLDVFEAYGYEQVAPPLLEYSDHLLSGRGATLSNQMFRVMDTSAHRVMAIRPDITLQIARIASSKLANAPRPLRLCYNGLIMRMQADQLKTDRQLRQAGIELIGASGPGADAEVILVAARALSRAGIKTFTIDVSIPSITAALVSEDALGAEELEQLYTALSHKDSSSIRRLDLKHKDALIALLEHTGDATTALKAIASLTLPEAARGLCHNLNAVVKLLLKQKETGWHITVDVTEQQGFNYHSGVGFAIFVEGVAHEVGRGGRYRIGSEEATGFTLYVETLRGLLPTPAASEKVLVEAGADESSYQTLQSKGFVTIGAVSQDHLTEQAATLGCKHIFEKGTLRKL